MKKLLQIGAVLLLTGCQTTDQIYYWGDYSQSVYEYNKNPSVSTTNEFRETLEDIIDTSNSENMKVPPGVYFELGYLNLKLNNSAKGMEYLNKEREIYPESEKVIATLIKQTGTTNNEN